MKRSERIAKDAAWVACVATVLLIIVAASVAVVKIAGINDAWWAVLLAAALTMPAIDRTVEAVRLMRLSNQERRMWEGGAR